MTGGRRRPEDLEDYAPLGVVRIVPEPPTPDEAATLQLLEGFKRGMAFRRNLQRALRWLNVSFAEWRVLEATSRLNRQKRAPVSHLEVARELQLGEGSVSRLMWRLSRRGLVSHDLDGLGLEYRVLMTDESERIVAAAYLVAAGVASGARARDAAPLSRGARA
jgi:predicted transcriptional regulator